jgi:hypothetical protein
MKLQYLLVTGLGVETSVMALVGVDKSYSSIFLDILHIGRNHVKL